MRIAASFTALAGFVAAASALTLPINRHSANHTLAVRQDSGPKQVFAHFMLGIVASYTMEDWEQDIRQAMGVGIDGFALNAGVDSYTHTQLQNAYQAAVNVGEGRFKMFISFDFTSFPVGDVNLVADYIKEFGPHEAQLKVNDRVFVSTFYGEGFQFRAAESAAGIPIFSCPAWGPDALGSADADCGFQWNSWPTQDNKPIAGPLGLDGDKWWQQHLNGKPYMAGASPWFFTHYGADTWNKNWYFQSETLWTDRWQSLLELAPQFIEIITWNDYGESSYVGPLRDEKPDIYAGGATGATKWTPGHDHSAWATVAAPFIAAYKQGSTTPVVTSEHLVYHYRQQSKDLSCSDPVPPPDGTSLAVDNVYATVLLLEPATVVISSGGNGPVSIEVEAGVHTVSAPMGVGKQTFAVVRGGATIATGDGYRDIRGECDVNDFNPFVGGFALNGDSSSAPAPAPATPAPEQPAPAPEQPAPAPEQPAPVPETPAQPATGKATFSTKHETVWGDNVYVTGNIDALGNWDTTRAVLLNTDASTYPNWSVDVAIPAGTDYEYKFILKTPSGDVTWEADVVSASS